MIGGEHHPEGRDHPVELPVGKGQVFRVGLSVADRRIAGTCQTPRCVEKPLGNVDGRDVGAAARHIARRPAGEEFVPIVIALGVWGQRWTRRQLQEHEIDLDLLLWAMENSVNPAAFKKERGVVEIQFTDQPVHKRRWWFLNENKRCELCIREPGFDIDLYIRSDLPTLIYVWRGDMSLTQALKADRLEAHGDRTALKTLRAWLGVSSLAHVQPAEHQ